ncbi:MAG: hypothetical protein HW410_148 [Nitrosarchaeum sp.]|nr:hypothetical protein [Nitrosarchaeum sp.]
MLILNHVTKKIASLVILFCDNRNNLDIIFNNNKATHDMMMNEL